MKKNRSRPAKGADAEKQSRFPTLGHSHRRAITIALTALDERLCEFERIAQGAQVNSVFRKEVNRLSASQRKQLLAQIDRMRGMLRELKDGLGLDARVEDLARNVWGSSTAFWEVLVETGAKYLRRYGDVPPGLGEYLDPKLEALIAGLSEIGEIASGTPRTAAAEPPRAPRKMAAREGEQ